MSSCNIRLPVRSSATNVKRCVNLENKHVNKHVYCNVTGDVIVKWKHRGKGPCVHPGKTKSGRQTETTHVLSKGYI